MPLLRYTFLEYYNKDPDFPFNTTQPQSSARKPDRLFQLERAPDRLNGQCSCLLEMKEESDSFVWQYEAELWWRKERQVVSFTHRSVYDFLKRLEIQQVAKEIQTFDIIQAICQYFLAELRLETKRWNTLFLEAYKILPPWKTRTTPESPPFRFLDYLHNGCLGIQKLTPRRRIFSSHVLHS
jgi:hypothetical protein